MQHDGSSRQDGGLDAALLDAVRLYGELPADDPLIGLVERALRALARRLAALPDTIVYSPGGGWHTG